MATTTDETGRFRQRRRTRAAIVAAAAELLKSGKSPSVNDVAEAAEVSRRTVYLYFPTLEQLLLDATLGMLSQAAVDEAIDAADAGDDAGQRVAAMIRALSEMSTETLPLGRSLIRLTVEASPPEDRSTAARLPTCGLDRARPRATADRARARGLRTPCLGPRDGRGLGSAHRPRRPTRTRAGRRPRHHPVGCPCAHPDRPRRAERLKLPGRRAKGPPRHARCVVPPM